MYPTQLSPTTRGDESRSDICTPPLVFTPHHVGTQAQSGESVGTPPMEPLQVFANFNVHSSGAGSQRRESGQLCEAENSPIRVRIRTRDGCHSPYLTGNPNAVQTELDNQGPYGFSYSGRSTPVAASTPNTRMGVPSFGQVPQEDPHRGDGGYHSGQQQPLNNQFYLGAACQGYGTGAQQPAVPPQERSVVSEKVYSHSSLDPSFELPAEVVHRALKGRCRFIAFPANLPTPPTSGHTAHTSAHDDTGVALFIGQVRFETTPAELTWLVQRTCGAVASRLEGRGAGCYLLYCRSETDLQLIRGLHKRVLFDVGGAWLARTPEEVDALCEYVAIDAPLLSKKARLPRDSMVVEDLKVDMATASHRGAGKDNNSQSSQSGTTKRSGHGRSASQHTGNNAKSTPRQQPHANPYWQGGNISPHVAAAPPPDYNSSVGYSPSLPQYSPQ